MFTTSQGLAGSVSENWRGSAEEGDGVGDGTEGAATSVAGAAVVPSAVGVGVTDAEGAADAEADDGGTALGASGVQAARTVSPAPAARKRVKLRRLVAAAAEGPTEPGEQS